MESDAERYLRERGDLLWQSLVAVQRQVLDLEAENRALTARLAAMERSNAKEYAR